jgi:hypothetical protein
MLDSHNNGYRPIGVIFCAFFTFAAMACAGTYSGGTGTAANPYKIASKADLFALAATPGDYSKCFMLTADIDLAGETFTTAVIAPDTKSYSGFDGKPFTGLFDGNGHIISNLTIAASGKDYIGLFGSVDSGGQIRNLCIENSNLKGRDYVGCLVGYNDSGTITSCRTNGVVSGSRYTGGLVGENSGKITECSTAGAVSGWSDSAYISGLVGENHKNITACYTTCTVTSNGDYTGGLVGCSWGGTITACYATGAVSGSDHTYNIGGLVGRNDGMIVACYASGMVSGSTYYYDVGGLVGENYNKGTIKTSFWDIQTTGQTGSSGGKGLSTDKMKALSIYQNAGWTDYGWVIQDGADYPRLSWENTGGTPIPPAVIPFAGTGTEEDPYLISTPQEFAALSWYSGVLDKQIHLTQDLDMNNMLLYPIGDLGPITGVFDGENHVLRNVKINQPKNHFVGIFSSIGSGGQIRNLGVMNADIRGGGNLGGLVGMNFPNGTITSCYVTGSIVGTDGIDSEIGGLAGYSSGTIESCYADSTVKGFSNAVTSSVVGGLVGRNDSGTVKDCYAAGTLNGSVIGGLVGYNCLGRIVVCYATGTVKGSEGHDGGLVGENWGGEISACFWDMQTSGQTGSSGGRGLTTEQMKTLSIYQNAGWADQGWVMQDGADYPRLSWENTDGTPIPQAVIPFAGSGTTEDPYVISTAEEFAALSWYSGVLNRQICLTQDLDLSGVSLYPIGDLGSFTGEFDGKGYVLSNGAIHQPEDVHVGLFSVVGSGGQIRNLGVENVNITGYRYVGSLVGYNMSGSVTSCYAIGAVSGTGEVGGLVGENAYGVITSCYATGTVSGSYYNVGGLVGLNYVGRVMACYASGAVSGTGEIGGLVGYTLSGSITSCYASGAVSGTYSSVGGLVGVNENAAEITDCFWDRETTGRAFSGGGTGLTTAEMKTLSTFTGAGWDFVGESVNGTADVWRMCADGVEYPRLSWEFSTGGDFACPDGVSLDDLLYLAGRWLASTPATVGSADVDGNGKVDLSDFEVLADNWMRM